MQRIGSRVLDFATFGGREFQTNQGEIESLDKEVEEFAKEMSGMDEMEYLDLQYAKFEAESKLSSKEANPFKRAAASEAAQRKVGSGEVSEYRILDNDDDYDDEGEIKYDNVTS